MKTDLVTTLISGWALVAAAIIGVVTRWGNALITNKTAPDWITGPIALVLSGLGALAAYIVDVKGVGTWQGALTVFVGALVATKGVQAIDPGIEPALKKGGLQVGTTAGGPVSYKTAVDVPSGTTAVSSTSTASATPISPYGATASTASVTEIRPYTS